MWPNHAFEGAVATCQGALTREGACGRMLHRLLCPDDYLVPSTTSICSSFIRPPCTVTLESAASISVRSAGVSSTWMACRFSSRWIQVARTRDRNDPRLLRQQPSQCDLRRRCVLLRGNSLQQIHDRPVRGQVLGREAIEAGSKIRLRVELRARVDLPGQISPCQAGPTERSRFPVPRTSPARRCFPGPAP